MHTDLRNTLLSRYPGSTGARNMINDAGNDHVFVSIRSGGMDPVVYKTERRITTAVPHDPGPSV